jgi:Uma2 family endonuclease
MAAVIQSPRLVVEVLSPSTEVRDRGRKLQCYLACPTIEEYLLVDSRSIRIEIYRKEQKKWVYEAFQADDEVELTTLDVRFPIEDAYEDVIFEKEENAKQSGN